MGVPDFRCAVPGRMAAVVHPAGTAGSRMVDAVGRVRVVHRMAVPRERKGLSGVVPGSLRSVRWPPAPELSLLGQLASRRYRLVRSHRPQHFYRPVLCVPLPR